MRYSYDETVDALYVKLLDAAPEHQHVLADGVVVDVLASGEVVGVEVLGAAATGWDPSELRAQGLVIEDYEMLAMMSLAGSLGVLTLPVDVMPTVTNGERLVAVAG